MRTTKATNYLLLNLSVLINMKSSSKVHEFIKTHWATNPSILVKRSGCHKSSNSD